MPEEARGLPQGIAFCFTGQCSKTPGAGKILRKFRAGIFAKKRNAEKNLIRVPPERPLPGTGPGTPHVP
ncbi:MAG: hypothetical protein A4E34_00589 [Methanoregula sp. PtaU1.Bin006]|nr:MAG: hypothetical protein A4E33_02468 [Methanoregula sp. PtaB.Bin085]OPY35589.1 MAG: hypothetical protein A4E34_00589 [Methanoregula sp. PtaU1.Bin006]